MKVLITKTIKRTPVYSKLFQWKHLTIVLTVLGMLFMATSAYSQNIKVKGRVTSDNGQPVARASVVVKGTTNGVTANDNGDFEITAPANGTLVISAVNFTSQEVRINNKQTVDVTMVTLEKTEAEVVVTGYGTTRKKDVTGSVATITGATLKEVPAPNFIAQLKGRTAGVDIVSNSATPGGGGQIRIRGNRSMTRSQGESDQLDAPLLVVDGVPLPPGSSINDINPDDITSVDILKDASATAIYGSRGAGGVILITSKRGRTGKMITSYDGYVGISNILGKLNVFNGAELAKFKTDAALYNRTNWPTSFNTTSYALTAPEQAALAAGVSTDWQDLIYQQGVVTSHNLGLSGGNEGTQYVFSGGYYKETGIIPHQNYERYSSRISLDHQINNRIKVGATLYNVLSYSNTPGGSGVTSGLVRTTPLASPYNPDGTVNLQPQFGSVDAAAISPLTLKTKASEILAKNRRLASSVNLYGEVKIIEGLRYRFNGNFSYVQNHGDGYSGPGTFVQNNTSQSASSASVNDQEGWTLGYSTLIILYKNICRKAQNRFYRIIRSTKRS